jgi:AICAR transformylase/IMP cyclohydrolase PurH
MREVIGEVPGPISAKKRSLWLRQLADVSLASDGFLPFRDNIDRPLATAFVTSLTPEGQRGRRKSRRHATSTTSGL